MRRDKNDTSKKIIPFVEETKNTLNISIRKTIGRPQTQKRPGQRLQPPWQLHPLPQDQP